MSTLPPSMPEFDALVVGAGAAGLMAVITAARTNPSLRLGLLDSARKPGAKIRIAGGGRCNVTHRVVTESDFCGSTPPAVRKVLRHMSVEDVVVFFRELGVALKTESTGKLFPVTDKARTITDALFREVDRLGITLLCEHRVESVEQYPSGYALSGSFGLLHAKSVVLATGGKSLPKSGSDGHGYAMATALGHALTEHLFPALVPLLLNSTHPLLSLSGVASDVTLNLHNSNGKILHSASGALLCTHFGVSGPVVLDMSRHVTQALLRGDHPTLHIAWLPSQSEIEIDQALRSLRQDTIETWLTERFPKRLAAVLANAADVAPDTPGAELRKDARRRLVKTLLQHEVPSTGDRGWRYAEVTAGGIPLRELNLATMESRISRGLHLCGEILDVDGRIGGFNFQWAWASGRGAGLALASSSSSSS